LIIANPQNLCVFSANPNPSYPDAYNGIFGMPTASGKLKSSIIRMIGLKDYYPNSPDINSTFCTPNDEFAKAAYFETLDRLQKIGVDAIWVYNYGSWDDFSKPIWTMTNQLSIPDLVVKYLIQQAHDRNMKVYLKWQFGSVAVAGGMLPMIQSGQSELPLSQITQMLDSWDPMITSKATLYGGYGLDGIAADWDSFYIGQPSYKSYYILRIKDIVKKIRSTFNGQITYGNSGPTPDAELASMIDMYDYSIGQRTATANENNNLSVPLLNSMMTIDPNSQIPLNTPLMIGAQISSTRNYFTTGWTEDGFCVNSSGGMTSDIGSCVQLSYSPDFSVQALGIESFFESVNIANNPNIKAVLLGASYWHTDNLTPYPAFPNLSQSFRNKPSENIVKSWFAR